MIKTLGIIPARGGSKGISQKNIALLGGKPLIFHTIKSAKQSSLLDHFLVSTDDPKIAKIARSLDADVPFLRPRSLAGDRSPDIGFLRHALNWVEKHRGWQPEIIIILQPTSPFRTGNDIDAIIRLIQEENCDSVRTVVDPSPYNPFKMWTFKRNQLTMKPLLPTNRFTKLGTDVPRQLLPKYFLQVGLVYATKSKFIKNGKVWGPKMCGYVMPGEKFVDIDSPKDLARANALIKTWGRNPQNGDGSKNRTEKAQS